MDNGHFRKADEAEMTGLRQIFSRGGFMRGYAMGAEDAGVIDPARVSHGGVKIGRVEFAAGNMARVRLERSLDDGDGLQIRTAQGDAELIYAGHDTEAGQIAVVRLRPDIRTKAGDEVYRLTSEKQLQWARSLMIPAIPADMMVVAYPGKPLALTMTDGESSVTVTGDTVAPAQSRAMSEEDARRSLGKLSDTPFSLRALTVQTAGAFVPVSALNQLRREACQQLAEARIAAFTRKAVREETADDLIYPDTPDVPSVAIVRTREQADAVQGAADLLVWYPEDFRADALESGLRDMPDGVWLQLPTVCEEKTLDELDAFVQRNAGKLGGIVLGSVGQLGRTWNVPMGAGSGIPVMNRRAGAVSAGAGVPFRDGKQRTVRRGIADADAESSTRGCSGVWAGAIDAAAPLPGADVSGIDEGTRGVPDVRPAFAGCAGGADAHRPARNGLSAAAAKAAGGVSGAADERAADEQHPPGASGGLCADDGADDGKRAGSGGRARRHGWRNAGIGRDEQSLESSC